MPCSREASGGVSRSPLPGSELKTKPGGRRTQPQLPKLTTPLDRLLSESAFTSGRDAICGKLLGTGIGTEVAVRTPLERGMGRGRRRRPDFIGRSGDSVGAAGGGPLEIPLERGRGRQ